MFECVLLYQYHILLCCVMPVSCFNMSCYVSVMFHCVMVCFVSAMFHCVMLCRCHISLYLVISVLCFTVSCYVIVMCYSVMFHSVMLVSTFYVTIPCGKFIIHIFLYINESCQFLCAFLSCINILCHCQMLVKGW